jgi:hypothetical protein
MATTKNPYIDAYMTAMQPVRQDGLQHGANRQITPRQQETIDNGRVLGTALDMETALAAYAIQQSFRLGQVVADEQVNTLIAYDEARKTRLSEDSRNRLEATIHTTDLTLAGIRANIMRSYDYKVQGVLTEPVLAPKTPKAVPTPQPTEEIVYDEETFKLTPGERWSGRATRPMPRVRRVR